MVARPRRRGANRHHFIIYLAIAAACALYYPSKFSLWASNTSEDVKVQGDVAVSHTLAWDPGDLPPTVSKLVAGVASLTKVVSPPTTVLMNVEAHSTANAPMAVQSVAKQPSMKVPTELKAAPTMLIKLEEKPTMTIPTAVQSKSKADNAEAVAKKTVVKKNKSVVIEAKFTTKRPVVIQARSKTGPKPLCIRGIVIPNLYILGQQRAGSSALVRILVEIGVLYARNTSQNDQAWFLDKDTISLRTSRLCKYIPEPHRSNATWTGQVTLGCTSNFSNYSISKKEQSWLRTFTNKCKTADRGQIFVDSSPVNFRMPGLPPILLHVYGDKAKQLAFAIALREPLKRLHSGYHHIRSFNKSMFSFEEYGKMILDELPSYKERNWTDLENSYRLDQMYRSLYALNMEPWFYAFNADQFIIVPMKLMKTQPWASEGLTQIAEKLKITDFKLPTWAVLKVILNKKPRKAIHWHPLAEELTNETRDGLQAYFDADTKKLSKILAPRITQGLHLLGYSGQERVIDDKDVMAFLISSW